MAIEPPQKASFLHSYTIVALLTPINSCWGLLKTYRFFWVGEVSGVSLGGLPHDNVFDVVARGAEQSFHETQTDLMDRSFLEP